MTYNPKSGNPFSPCDNTEWTTNGLILQDPKLRALAGVDILDSNVTEAHQCQVPTPVPAAQKAGCPGWNSQNGGATMWAPLHMYNRKQKGGMPWHYFSNNLRW
jgi:hypothetical protein